MGTFSAGVIVGFLVGIAGFFALYGLAVTTLEQDQLANLKGFIRNSIREAINDAEFKIEVHERDIDDAVDQHDGDAWKRGREDDE